MNTAVPGAKAPFSMAGAMNPAVHARLLRYMSSSGGIEQSMLPRELQVRIDAQ